MDKMGTPTRRTTGRSRISSWGGGRGRETGTEREQCSQGHTAQNSVTTQASTPSPGSSLLALHPGPRGPQRDTPGYRGRQEIPHLRHLSGSPPPVVAQNVHNATLAAPFRPVRPESSPFRPVRPKSSPCPGSASPHCTLARSRPPPPTHPVQFPRPRRRGTEEVT